MGTRGEDARRCLGLGLGADERPRAQARWTPVENGTAVVAAANRSSSALWPILRLPRLPSGRGLVRERARVGTGRLAAEEVQRYTRHRHQR